MRTDCIDLSAAFAYHTLQSFFPALLIALAIASRVLGNDRELVARLLELVARILPSSAVAIFEATLTRFTNQGYGAGLLGLLLLCLSASNIYLTLQRGADRIWWNRPFGLENLPWPTLVRRYLWLRLKSLGLLLLVGVVIGLDQLISHLRLFGSRHLRTWVLAALPEGLQGVGDVSAGVDLGLSFLLGFAVSLLFLWVLPSRRIPLQPLIPGALLLSLSVTVLNLLLARSIVLLGVRFQAYGVVGGVLVLTLWIWLVGVLLYYGQCLSLVCARRGAGRRSALLSA
ncbi:MAG: YihY/virulence factor BrkB family protein [Synechococcaceae cyanobacterium]|nr:YihY/virulence factor BrkB family protein [Synechococcaceae cyanobacterium]